MKFNYTKINGETIIKCAIDLDVIYQHMIIPASDNKPNTLVLFTTLEPTEYVEQIPKYKIVKGQPVIEELRPTKLIQQTIVEVTVEEEIQNYLGWFRQQESI